MDYKKRLGGIFAVAFLAQGCATFQNHSRPIHEFGPIKIGECQAELKVQDGILGWKQLFLYDKEGKLVERFFDNPVPSIGSDLEGKIVDEYEVRRPDGAYVTYGWNYFVDKSGIVNSITYPGLGDQILNTRQILEEATGRYNSLLEQFKVNLTESLE